MIDRKNIQNKFLPYALSLMLMGFTGCGSEPVAVTNSIAVEVAALEKGALSTQNTYIGTVTDADETMVVSMVSAKVMELNVEVGDVVSAGDVLCKLDDTAARIQMDNAKASLNSAQASYNSAVAQADAQLGGQKALSDFNTDYSIDKNEANLDDVKDDIDDVKNSMKKVKKEMEQAEGDMADAKAKVDIFAEDEGAAALLESATLKYNNLKSRYSSLQAQLEQLRATKKNYEDALNQAYGAKEITETEVLADTQRIVDATKAAAGANVASAKVGVESAQYQLDFYTLTAPVAGMVSAVNVSENNYCNQGTVSFVLSSAEAKEVVFYVTDNVKKEFSIGQEVLVNSDGTEYRGVISEIGITTDAQTGLFLVKAEIYDANELPAGSRVELVTVSHSVEDAYIIPTDALYFENGMPYVYIAAEDTARLVPVEIALYTAENVAIDGAFAGNEQVITSWSSYLRDGAQIQVAEQDMGEWQKAELQ